MVNGFTKQKEGVDAYAAIGKPYPTELFDGFYEQWVADTTAEGLPKGTKEKMYGSLCRIQPGWVDEDTGERDNSSEFLIYHLYHTRIDKAGNPKCWFLPNIGMYPIPHPLWEVKDVDFNRKERFVREIASVTEGYSIPWNQKTIEWIKKLKKEGDLYTKALHFYVRKGAVANRYAVLVETFEDFLTGNFEELWNYSKIVKSAEERKELDRKIEANRSAITIAARGY